MGLIKAPNIWEACQDLYNFWFRGGSRTVSKTGRHTKLQDAIDSCDGINPTVVWVDSECASEEYTLKPNVSVRIDAENTLNDSNNLTIAACEAEYPAYSLSSYSPHLLLYDFDDALDYDLGYGQSQWATGGGVLALEMTNPGLGYVPENGTMLSTNGNGFNCSVDILSVDAQGRITSFRITDPGQDYTYDDVGVTLNCSQTPTQNALFNVTLLTGVPREDAAYDYVKNHGGMLFIAHPELTSTTPPGYDYEDIRDLWRVSGGAFNGRKIDGVQVNSTTGFLASGSPFTKIGQVLNAIHGTACNDNTQPPLFFMAGTDAHGLKASLMSGHYAQGPFTRVLASNLSQSGIRSALQNRRAVICGTNMYGQASPKQLDTGNYSITLPYDWCRVTNNGDNLVIKARFGKAYCSGSNPKPACRLLGYKAGQTIPEFAQVWYGSLTPSGNPDYYDAEWTIPWNATDLAGAKYVVPNLMGNTGTDLLVLGQAIWKHTSTGRFVAASNPFQNTTANDRWYNMETHCHTVWSDGTFDPIKLRDYYNANGYDIVAITDHNKKTPLRENLLGTRGRMRVEHSGNGAAITGVQAASASQSTYPINIGVHGISYDGSGVRGTTAIGHAIYAKTFESDGRAIYMVGPPSGSVIEGIGNSSGHPSIRFASSVALNRSNTIALSGVWITLTSQHFGGVVMASHNASFSVVLPTDNIAAGTTVRIVNVANQNMTVLPASGTIVTRNSSSAASVVFNTTNQKLGAMVECVYYDSKWHVFNRSDCTMTVN